MTGEAILNRPPLPGSDCYGADLRVLDGFALQPGIQIESTSRFADDVWDLNPAIHRDNIDRTALRLDFTRLASREQALTAKELIYARLQDPVPGYRHISPETAVQDFQGCRTLFARLAEWFDVRDLTSLDQDLLDRLMARAKASGEAQTVLAFLANMPVLFYHYRSRLTLGGVPIRPWRGTPAYKVAGRVFTGENTTPRIPETVMGPLLQWSWRYVQDYSGEILAALEARKAPPIHWDGVVGNDRIAAYLAMLRADRRGLPSLGTSDGQYSARRASLEQDPLALVNWKQVSREMGLRTTLWNSISPTSLSERRQMFLDAFPDLGYDWERAATERPGSLLALLQGGLGGPDLYNETQHLITACYVIIAFLSGMRDSEVASLRPGCLRLERSADGIIARHKVRGLVFKGRSLSGDEEDWVVIAPVARAIETLERLHGMLGNPIGLPLVFTWQGLSRRGGSRKNLMSRYINEFAVHVSDLARSADEVGARLGSRPGAPGPVPDHEGEPWSFKTKQFRRTVAWFIANRPFGVVAGAIQFKHAEIAIFEGYGGTSKSGFRQEVEIEAEQARVDALFDAYEDWRTGEVVLGNGAARIEAVFRSVQDEAGDFPGRITDERRIRDLLESKARMLHPGLLNDCFYSKEEATCRDLSPHAPGDGPLFQVCNPAKCPNAMIRQKHRARWKRAEQMVDDRLAQGERLGRMPTLQREVLLKEKSRIRDILELMGDDAEH